jgi:hypothetical protein
MKSGNLIFLEPSGSLQPCNGTALPLPYLSNAIESLVVIQSFIFRLFMNYRIKSKFLAVSIIPYLKCQLLHIDIAKEK